MSEINEQVYEHGEKNEEWEGMGRRIVWGVVDLERVRIGDIGERGW